ncbi:uncharacterized protein BKA78DRAFT_173457 [Phyllosticta capitalensis]|uniref:uncharacterized protein n=1 Tax=Phyllosticta capitalensis TaxID=121624 RepID=UPI00312CD3A6
MCMFGAFGPSACLPRHRHDCSRLGKVWWWWLRVLELLDQQDFGHLRSRLRFLTYMLGSNTKEDFIMMVVVVTYALRSTCLAKPTYQSEQKSKYVQPLAMLIDPGERKKKKRPKEQKESGGTRTRGYGDLRWQVLENTNDTTNGQPLRLPNCASPPDPCFRNRRFEYLNVELGNPVMEGDDGR